MNEIHNKQCFNNHMGPWLIEPKWFSNAVNAIKQGIYPMRPVAAEKVVNQYGDLLYSLSPEGVATISLSGVMMKHESKFSDTVSTVRMRQALRTAANDDKVLSIVLMIDSPGGSLAGTAELAGDVKNIDSKKPVLAHFEDLGCSAAFWVGSQARRVTANATAMIGSIGTVAVVHDTSKQAEMLGVKVHVISTGDFKGAFTDGTPVTEEQLNYYQELINKLNAHFLNAVSEGRKIEMKDLKEIADGRVFVAADAKKLGLIDAIETSDGIVAYAASKFQRKRSGMKSEHANFIRNHRM